MAIPPARRRRPWPNHAAGVRDSCAEISNSGVQDMEPVVNGEISDPDEVYRRCARALNRFQRISRKLESVGAQTEAQ
jgi:hypothetical protein